MGQESPLSFTQRGLAQQGYHELPASELDRLTWGLRFTPGLCMLGALVGLALQLPALHFLLAALGTLAFFVPAHHPLDLLYNHAVRHLFSAPALPPNPLPRRIACLLGGLMNLAIGVAFVRSAPAAAYAIGAMLVVLQIIVIYSHFCVASWLLQLVAPFVWGSTELVSGSEARALVQRGALLVDVRSPSEFASGHLPGAINAPLGQFEAHIEELTRPERPLILYCTAGVRTRRAAKMLEDAGAREVHELGSMKRWDS